MRFRGEEKETENSKGGQPNQSPEQFQGLFGLELEETMQALTKM